MFAGWGWGFGNLIEISFPTCPASWGIGGSPLGVDWDSIGIMVPKKVTSCLLYYRSFLLRGGKLWSGWVGALGVEVQLCYI